MDIKLLELAHRQHPHAEVTVWGVRVQPSRRHFRLALYRISGWPFLVLGPFGLSLTSQQGDPVNLGVSLFVLQIASMQISKHMMILKIICYCGQAQRMEAQQHAKACKTRERSKATDTQSAAQIRRVRMRMRHVTRLGRARAAQRL